MSLRASWMVCIVGCALALAVFPAVADDASKTAPAAAAAETEKAQDVDVARSLEKRLSAPNKLDMVDAIEGLGKLNIPTSRKILMMYIAGTPNSEYGSKAVKVLGIAGNTTVVDFLCGKDGARSPRILVAQAACESLAVIGDKKAIPTLLECMKADKAVVVCAAVESVVKLDPAAEGLAERLTALSTVKDDFIRMSVATALGSLVSPKAVTALIAMTKDSNSIVRLNTCTSIGKLAPWDARSAMENLAAHDKSKDVRAAASDALSKIPTSPPPLKGDPAAGGNGK